MFKSPLSGIPSYKASQMYTPMGSGKSGYKLNPAQRQKAIDELEIKFAHGIISEQEYEKEYRAIESAPMFVGPQGERNPILSSEGLKSEEDQRLEELKKLGVQYANGEISDFTFRANQYLLSNPDVGPQHQIDTYA